MRHNKAFWEYRGLEDDADAQEQIAAIAEELGKTGRYKKGQEYELWDDAWRKWHRSIHGTGCLVTLALISLSAVWLQGVVS